MFRSCPFPGTHRRLAGRSAFGQQSIEIRPNGLGILGLVVPANGPVKTLAERYRKAGSFKTQYWTPEVHKAAFALPRFIANAIARAGKR